MGDCFGFSGGVELVGIEVDNGEVGLVVFECIGKLFVEFFGQIEIIDGMCDVEVGIGIELVGKVEFLVLKIVFDLKVGIEFECFDVMFLKMLFEFFGEVGFGQIGDVGCYLGNCEFCGR